MLDVTIPSGDRYKSRQSLQITKVLPYQAPSVDLQAKLIHCLHRILIRFTQPLWA
jgi:hypothetical protein